MADLNHDNVSDIRPVLVTVTSLLGSDNIGIWYDYIVQDLFQIKEKFLCLTKSECQKLCNYEIKLALKRIEEETRFNTTPPASIELEETDIENDTPSSIIVGVMWVLIIIIVFMVYNIFFTHEHTQQEYCDNAQQAINYIGGTHMVKDQCYGYTILNGWQTLDRSEYSRIDNYLLVHPNQ